jgi:hypothetical protein
MASLIGFYPIKPLELGQFDGKISLSKKEPAIVCQQLANFAPTRQKNLRNVPLAGRHLGRYHRIGHANLVMALMNQFAAPRFL